jgi:hypothetical protein
VRSVLRPQKRVAAEAVVALVVVVRRPRQPGAVVVAAVAVQRRQLADEAVLPQQPENLRQLRLPFLQSRRQRQMAQPRPVVVAVAVARQRPVAAVEAVVVERQLLQPARRFN